MPSLHALGLLGLVVVFLVGTLRPVNLGAAALVMTFLLGALVAGEDAAQMLAGFPVQLLALLVGVTYLFGVASVNGTVERIVNGAARAVGGRRAAIPWIVFVVASLPAMAGALGSAGVALLAPLSMQLAKRYDVDRRMIGLMVVHGAAAGNFSPLNVLGAIVHQAVLAGGLQMSYPVLFFGNLIFNVALAAVIFVLFGGLGLRGASPGPPDDPLASPVPLQRDQLSTLLVLLAVAVTALGFGLDVGLVALTGAVALHLAFPRTSAGADKLIAWSVVLLVCGVVTYVSALQRYGTVDAVGDAIAGLGSPLLVALLLCYVAGATSAIASSAGILGALVPLALPLLAGGAIGTTGVVVALALSATLVDATPFSTVGALSVASAVPEERDFVYRGMLAWGAAMVLIAPLVSWLVFVLPAR